MPMFSAPKGVPEYFGERGAAFLAVRNALAAPAIHAGFHYAEIPVFEDTALFVRGVGASTDVVSKEMYTFDDRGGRSLSLRPEGTAGVMRMVVEHHLDRGQLPVKMWYAGPFFRAERPQHGRYRQLQQVGVEAIGVEDPALDAEVIAVADEAFRALGLQQYQLLLTSLGCASCRPAYRTLLMAFLSELDLDETTRERALLNPLRVLDDKRDSVQAQLADAPLMSHHLCEACATYHQQVCGYLDLLGVAWTDAPRLVRGLDYYTRTTFEFTHDLLGAQSGIGGGGRYDGLMASLGGSELSGIGFGLGTDRTLLACEAEGLSLDAGTPDVFVIAIGAEAKAACVRTAGKLRRCGVVTQMSFGDRGLKGAMKAADKSGARLAVIVGDHEVSQRTAVLKDLRSGQQIDVEEDDIAARVVSQLKGAAQ